MECRAGIIRATRTRQGLVSFELRVKLPLDALVQCDAGRIYPPPNVHAYGHHGRRNSSKQRIYGDLWYQSPTLRFAKSAEQRADNFSDMGILAERPTTEIDAILRRLPDTFGNELCDRRLRIRSFLELLVEDLQTTNSTAGPYPWD
jgi:hypothetical protein